MSTLTVTGGKVGPGFTLANQPMQIKEFTIKCDQESLYAILMDDRLVDIDISAATTITVTVVGNNYTVTIT